MKATSIRKGLLVIVVGAAVGLGCELVVDFDRSKIPVEAVDATPSVDATVDAPVDTGVDAPADAADASDASDASDAGDAGDASDADPDADAGP